MEACSLATPISVNDDDGLAVHNVKYIFCISGKRKSGKDFFAERFSQHISNTLGKMVVISFCTLSAPLKEQFARLHGLNSDELLGHGPTKELVRKEMITFGEERRSGDYGIFCREAFNKRKFLNAQNHPNEPVAVEIMLVTDCRRPTDIQFFNEKFPTAKLYCVRIHSSMQTREQRGFVYTLGVDDAESECALDTYDGWHFRIWNDGTTQDGFKDIFDQIVKHLSSSL